MCVKDKARFIITILVDRVLFDKLGGWGGGGVRKYKSVYFATLFPNIIIININNLRIREK